MDTFFFISSKVIWALISPDSLIVILGISAWLTLILGWQKLSRRLLALCAFLLLMVGFLPIGEWLIAPLENRFAANTALPQQVDGIVVLGGAISPYKSSAWNQVQVGAGADRIIGFQYLAKLYPGAQLVYTGGSGALTDQQFKEAEQAQILMDQLDLSGRAIVFESESRNTYENAVNSKALLTPGSEEKWLLITSAFHMPRSVGVFCSLGWPVQAYPVDFYSKKGDLLRVEFNFSGNLQILRTAIREWVGLIAYRITGKTSEFLADDASECSVTTNAS